MKEKTFLSIFICTAFLTAQAAVDSGKSIKSINSVPTGPTKNQMPSQINSQLQDQVYIPNSLDLQLKERVQQQLRTSLKNYDPNTITILSRNGEVTLKGIVRNPEEAAEMEKEVLRVSGVSRVKNNLVLSLGNN